MVPPTKTSLQRLEALVSKAEAKAVGATADRLAAKLAAAMSDGLDGQLMASRTARLFVKLAASVAADQASLPRGARSPPGLFSSEPLLLSIFGCAAEIVLYTHDFHQVWPCAFCAFRPFCPPPPSLSLSRISHIPSPKPKDQGGLPVGAAGAGAGRI